MVRVGVGCGEGTRLALSETIASSIASAASLVHPILARLASLGTRHRHSRSMPVLRIISACSLSKLDVQSTSPPTTGWLSSVSRNACAFWSLPTWANSACQLGAELGVSLAATAGVPAWQAQRPRRLALRSALRASLLTVRHRVAPVARARELLVDTLDDVEHLVAVLAGGRAVRDGDDDDGLLELVHAHGAEEERLENLVHEVCAKGREARELHLLDEVHGRGLARDVVALDGRVHEADLDAVVVEERSGGRDAGHDAVVSKAKADTHSLRSSMRSPFSSKAIEPESST